MGLIEGKKMDSKIVQLFIMNSKKKPLEPWKQWGSRISNTMYGLFYPMLDDLQYQFGVMYWENQREL